MAHTARSEDDKKEFFDTPEILEQKISQLAKWIEQSNHLICFTGAGISTAAGIPDYRSGMNTALKTGPGVWELRANLSARDTEQHKVTPMFKAVPTPTHMMFVKLQQEGLLKCCISQNTDGLHRRSGLPKDALSELHGNANLERCGTCGKEYLRDLPLKRAFLPNHLTGRKCDDPNCKGPLKDTIIHFGENLPTDELTKAFQEGEDADLCIVMGSSLTVTPAADIPKGVAQRGHRLVIVNLQRTPLNHMASLVIHAKCEDVSRMLMTRLGVAIPEFKLKRRMTICGVPDKNGDTLLSISGRDIDGLPFSFFREVLITINIGDDGTHSLVPPFQTLVEWKDEAIIEQTVTIQIIFFANYGEPPVTREVIIKRNKDYKECLWMEYNTISREWNITPELIGAMESLST